MAIDMYEMKALASRIRDQVPNIAPGAVISSYTRDLLEQYAGSAGMSHHVTFKASNADLIGLYLVGRKTADGAVRMAEKITVRLNGPSLIEPAPVPAPPPYVNGTPSIPFDGVTHALLSETIAALTAEMGRGDRATLEAVQADFAALSEGLTSRLPGMIQEALKTVTPTVLTVQTPNSPPVSLGVVHRKTAKIIKWLSLGSNVYLHGPAGSGKTTTAMKCAEAFGLPFYCVAKVENEQMLLGYEDIKSDLVRTQFREAYEHGGVFLFDEMDASGSSAIVALNMALANGYCPFPDATIKMHSDFKCIGAGNTTLGGATYQYSGRNQLDGASIDRFVFVEFGYDEDLERAIAPDAQWCAYVQAARAEAAVILPDKLITPRATITGGHAILDGGLDRTEIEDATVYKGWDIEDRNTVHRAAMARLARG